MILALGFVVLVLEGKRGWGCGEGKSVVRKARERRREEGEIRVW